MLDLAMDGGSWKNMEAGTPESCCPRKQHISWQPKLCSNMRTQPLFLGCHGSWINSVDRYLLGMKHLRRFLLQPLLDKGFLEFEMCSVLLEGLKLALRRWCRPFICCCFRRGGRVHETSRTKGDSKQKGEAKKTLDSCTYSISPADFSKVSVCNDLKICLRVDSGQNRVEKTSLVKISITISIAWCWMFCGYIQALHLHGSVLYKASGLKHNTGQPRRVN